MRLEGKVAIITRGGVGNRPGVERHVCPRRGDRGGHGYQRPPRGKRLLHEIEAAGGKARYWHCDVSKRDEVKSMIEDVRDSFGAIDVLVQQRGVPSGVRRSDRYRR